MAGAKGAKPKAGKEQDPYDATQESASAQGVGATSAMHLARQRALEERKVVLRLRRKVGRNALAVPLQPKAQERGERRLGKKRSLSRLE